MAKALLEKETLNSKDIEAIMKGAGEEVKEEPGAEAS
jgi:ATP-dependent Zn protease